MGKLTYITFLAASFLVSVSFISSSFAQSCTNLTIQSVKPDGSVIVLDDGSINQVNDPNDQATASGWVAGDNVQNCGSTLVDLNADPDVTVSQQVGIVTVQP